MRLFTAITLPEEIKKKLQISADKIQKSCEKGNFSHFENYHITLVFLGDVPENKIDIVKQVIDKSAQGFLPFRLTCLEPSHFSKKNRKILFFNLGGDTDKLEELQIKLYQVFYANHLCNKQDKYTPHITFARQVKTDIYPRIYDKLEFTAGAITLMLSHRVDGKLTYSPIYTVPFDK